MNNAARNQALNIPLLPVASLILGLAGLLLGVKILFVPAEPLTKGLGFVGLGVVLLGSALYDIVLAVKRRITVGERGLAMGHTAISFGEVMGILPPAGRRMVGVALNDTPIRWSLYDQWPAYDALRKAMEPHWKHQWLRAFEQKGTVVYHTSVVYLHGYVKQAVVLLAAVPVLYLFEPWFGILLLVGVALLAGVMVKNYLAVPLRVTATPRELRFQYRNRVSTYLMAELEEADEAQGPDQPYILRFQGGRGIVVPVQRPFYHALWGYVEAQFAPCIVRGEDQEDAGDSEV